MSVFNPVSTSIVVILLVAGLIVGLSVAEIDLFNPWTASANAERITIEANHQQTIYTLEEQQKQIEMNALAQQKALELEQARQKSASDLAFEQRMNAIKTQVSESLASLWLILIALAGTLLTLGLAAIPVGFAVKIARSAPPATASPHPAAVQGSPPRNLDLWDDPDFRAWRKALARQRELQSNAHKVDQEQAAPGQKTLQSPPQRHSQSPQRYSDLPLVGDD